MKLWPNINKAFLGCPLLLFLLICVNSTTSCPPKITLYMFCETSSGCIFHDDVYQDHENYKRFESFNNNPTSFSLINSPKQIITGVELNCSAPYPVRWKSTQSDLLWGGTKLGVDLRAQVLVYARTAINASDLKTSTYSTVLHIGKKNTQIGEYKCERIINETQSSLHHTPDESVAIPIFAERNTEGKIFMLEGKNWTVSMDNPDKIVLPCNVFDPNANVNLLKENRSLNKWESVPVDNVTLIYKPEIGFIYRKNEKNVNGLQLTAGNYQCACDTKTDTGGQKSVNITLQPLLSREVSEVKYRVTHPANFSAVADVVFNRASVTCCSANNIPPELKVIKCRNKIDCAEKFLYDPNLTLGNPENVKVGLNCAEADYLRLPWTAAVNVLCSGDGVDVVKTLLFPESDNDNRVNEPSDCKKYTNKKSAYHSFEEADPQEMIRIGVANGCESELKLTESGQIVLMDGDTVEIWCSASRAYFEDGLFIVINYKNGTFERVTDEQNKRFNFDIDIDITKALKSFTCFAPKLFSTKWINKTIEILVEDQQLANTVKNTAVENIVLRGNETIDLVCNFEGSALPNETYWLKDGQKICDGSGSGNDNFSCSPVSPLKHNITLLLSVTPKNAVAGEYRCHIGNNLGIVQKTFKITTEK